MSLAKMAANKSMKKGKGSKYYEKMDDTKGKEKEEDKDQKKTAGLLLAPTSGISALGFLKQQESGQSSS